MKTNTSALVIIRIKTYYRGSRDWEQTSGSDMTQPQFQALSFSSLVEGEGRESLESRLGVADFAV